MILSALFAFILFETQQGGFLLSLESESKAIDPAKSVFVKLTLKAPPSHEATLPDLRDRAVGFSLAEDFVEEPVAGPDGSKTLVANWRLVPEPCADVYKIRPFAVLADGGRTSFVAGPVKFDPPPPREPVTGAMECSPTRDLPPLSWKLVGFVTLALLAALIVFGGLFLGLRYLVRRVKEHRMSPVERAWVELDRLLRKGLPGRGRYKDFYVELTMVVRRYIQRKYGIKAPHLTTEEFLAEIAKSGDPGVRKSGTLGKFLESADLVKFAGVEATPEMADGATESARDYLKTDSAPSGAHSGQAVVEYVMALLFVCLVSAVAWHVVCAASRSAERASALVSLDYP